MEKNESELDKILEHLNKNRDISNIVLDNLEDVGLTDGEKKFFKTYQPEKALIIYGSLAPGKPNHSKVQHINGKWEKGKIRGILENKGWGADMGYYGFRHTGIKELSDIEVIVLFSDELVANWQQLDEFEGNEYRRLLAKYKLDNGETGVGYIYAINETEW